MFLDTDRHKQLLMLQTLRDSVSLEIVLMTPDWAREILAKNTHNRSLRGHHAEAISRDMASDNFLFNGESIVISDTSVLMDGQHRLEACVRAGKPFMTVLVTGVPMVAIKTIDSGVSKTAGDQLKIASEANGNTIAAAIRFSMIWQRGRNPSYKPTTSEIMAFLARHPEVRDAVNICQRCYEPRMGHIPISVTNAFAANLLSAGVSPEKVESFLSGVTTGCTGEGTASYSLFKTLLKWNNQRQVTRSNWMYLAALIKSWNGLVLGRPPRIYRMRDEEQFPILLDDAGDPVRLMA